MTSTILVRIAEIVETDSSNAVPWVLNRMATPWRFQFLFNEIHILSTKINVVFRHELRSANFTADALANQGVGRVVP